MRARSGTTSQSSDFTTRVILVACVACVATLGLGLPKTLMAEDEPKPGASDESAAADLFIYVPPARGSAAARSGGGTRGRGGLPKALVLAPDHVAYTVEAQPTLSWYLSAATDTRIDFTLIDEDGVAPLLEISLDGPVKEGVHALRLRDFGLTLEEGRRYQWFVSLVPDPLRRANDVVAGAMIERTVRTSELDERLDAGGPDYVALAQSGIWYDALAALSAEIERRPDNAVLRETRAQLFDQIGLDGVASYDRASSHASPQ